MKQILSSLSIVLMLIGMSSSAFAEEGTYPDWADKSGGFGVGGETTMGGTHGLNLRYYISNQFGLQLTFGLGIASATEVDGDNSTSISSTAMGFGIYAMYKLAYWQRGHLSAIFGLDIHTLSVSTEATVGGTTTTDDVSGTDLLIGLGLHGEWFPTQYLSLFGQVGLRMDFIGSDELSGGSVTNTDSDLDYSGIDLGLGSDLLGSFGFTVWFN